MMPRTISIEIISTGFTLHKRFHLTVDIAETTCFTLFGVMKSSSPVDGNVAFAPVETSCSLHTATSANATEVKQSVEDWTIIANVIFALLLGEVVHVVWGDFLEEVDVLIGVKLGHFMTGSRFCPLGKGNQ
jgi:hypothetical protein